jgi:hypothetical protein
MPTIYTGIKRWSFQSNLFRILADLVRLPLGMPLTLRTLTSAYHGAMACYFTSELAEHYCQASRKHFLPLVNALGALITLDPEGNTTQNQIEELRKEAEAMRKRLEAMAVRNKERDCARMKNRLNAAERVVLDHVPDISQPQKALLENRVQDIADLLCSSNVFDGERI